MTADTLAKQLANLCAHGTLTLPEPAFGLDIARLFDTYLPSSRLTLTLQPVAAPGLIRTGTVSWPPLPSSVTTRSELSVRVEFSVAAAGVPQLLLVMTLPDPCALSQLFPEVDQTGLRILSLKDGHLTLCSYDRPSTAAGMSLSGSATLGDGLALVSKLLGVEDCPIAGTVRAGTGGAEIHLATDTPLTPPSMNMPVSLSFDATASGHGSYSGDIRLTTHVSIVGQEIHLSAAIPDDVPLVVFEVAFDPAQPGSRPALSGFSALEDLLTKKATLDPATLQQLLPSASWLSDVPPLHLDRASICVNLQTLAIDVVSATIGVSHRWDLLDGRLIVDPLQVQLAVAQPFSDSSAFLASVLGRVTIETIPFDVSCASDATLSVRLTDGHQIPAASVLSCFVVTPPIDLPALSVFEATVNPRSGAFDVAAWLGQWTVPIGDNGLTLGPVRVHAARGESEPATLDVEAWAELAGSQLNARGSVSGNNFELTATAETIPFGALISSLLPQSRPITVCSPGGSAATGGGMSLPMPAALDSLQLAGCSVTLVRQDHDCSLGVAVANVDGYGSLEFHCLTLKDGTWGVAASFSVPRDWKLSTLGETLRAFDDVTFDSAGLVLSSFTDRTFTFKQPGHTDWTGVTQGVRLAASITATPDQRGVFAHIGKFLCADKAHVDLSASLDPDLTDVTITGTIDGTFPLVSGHSSDHAVRPIVTLTEAGVSLTSRSNQLTASITGALQVVTDGHTLSFTASVGVHEDGAFGTGTMDGAWSNAFGVAGLTLADVALMIGCDWEGVPAVGVAGHLTLGSFDGSLALEFDSTAVPPAFLLAGSFSDVTLAQVVSVFCPSLVLGPSLALLTGVSLRGIKPFSLPATVTRDVLDASTLATTVDPRILEAFHGHEPALGSRLMLTSNKTVTSPATKWFLADRDALTTWQISAAASGLIASRETQLYVAEGAVSLGDRKFPAGFQLTGELDLFGVALDAEIVGDPHRGIFAEFDIPKKLAWHGLLTLSGSGGKNGPFFSLATYDAPESKIKGQHLVISGEANLLGVQSDGDVSLSLTHDGLEATVSGAVGSVTHSRLDVTIASATGLDVHGSFSFQLRESVGPILGPVSKLVLVPAISLDVAMTVDNAHFAAKVLPSGVVTVSVTFGGSFEWNGQHVTIGPTTRTITAGPADVSYLEQTASMVADAVVTDAANAFGFLFRDVKTGLMSADIWASSVGSYFRKRIANPVEVLQREFHVKDKTQTAGLLYSAGLLPEEILNVMTAGGYSLAESELKALAHEFGWVL